MKIDDASILGIDHAHRAYMTALALRHDADDRRKWPYCREGRQLRNACEQAKAQATAAFAALNGWKEDSRGACNPEGIGHRQRSYFNFLSDRAGLFDHCVNFRAGGKNVAVLTQPYHYQPVEAQHWTAARGLEMHIPPDPRSTDPR